MNDGATENPNMPKLPAELFDGYAVYEAMSPAAKLRTSPENVADTLDALAKVMRRNAGVLGTSNDQGENHG